MQELVEPVLYQQILVRNIFEAESFLAAIESRPHRASAVQQMEFLEHPAMLSHMELVRSLLIKVKKLKHLMFESPLVNSRIFEDNDMWLSMDGSAVQAVPGV